MIEVHEVSKMYGKKKSLDRLSLSVKKGQVYGLLGANGSGKSTLLKVLATVTDASGGNVTIAGYDIKKQAKPIRELIGFVPQELSIWEEVTVFENVRYWSAFSSKKLTKSALITHLEKIGLGDRANDKVKTLSGGMKRKLNIVIALLHDPDILLMDEPTVGIDFQSKFEINQLIKQLANEGKTIMYTTHDVVEVLFLCDEIGVLKDGQLYYSGTLGEARGKAGAVASDWSDEEVLYRLVNGQLF
ncbi:ABC transporter ATP-binding protein [Alkalihalophilus lindianensis]|uniref:ABC transporter ATP-binding protein n=1 Tax=Alkalihalophilus lindianensis TaxID=1630542 RepID=A0ABU3X9C0_9BACI|nr:ABC transporter ATP-binding protein [Alkalihalophilus lindianensis]MDV2684484.1 ABC transporter ATP-binding protein [Alkalihalophilus lindianensis]